MTKPPGTNPDADDWVVVAYILRPHGLGGTMRLKPLTPAPDDLVEEPRKALTVRRAGKVAGTLTWVRGQMADGVIHARFAEIADRTEAEKYVGAELVIRREELWDLEEDMYYLWELEGLSVRDAATKAEMGRVVRGMEGAAHDYLVLDLTGASKRETLLPLVPEMVPLVDIDGGFVEVRLPEGLLDLP